MMMNEKQNDASRAASGGERAREVPPLESPPAPRKVEGDALLSGTGTRHGVEKADERPETGPEEGPDRG
jgi:hypothetical protein